MAEENQQSDQVSSAPEQAEETNDNFELSGVEAPSQENPVPDTFEDVKFYPLIKFDKIQNLRQVGRTAVSVDLSGSATTLVCVHAEQFIRILKAYLLYTEASSADAGITIEVGKETDRDYYYTGTTEVSKAIWYTEEITLLKNDVTTGDTVTFYSAGGKTGTGEIMLVIEYKINAI